MPTPLETADLGPVTLLAPEEGVRHVVATYGHLWQWVGDGADLFTLAVAVRPTRLGTPVGARHHLAWELQQLRPGPPSDPQTDQSTDPGDPTVPLDRTDPSDSTGPTSASPVEVTVLVDGATGAAAADLVGEVRGNAVRQRVVVTTDGEHMHVVRLIVPDSDDGAQLLERVTSSLRVQPWSMPA